MREFESLPGVSAEVAAQRFAKQLHAKWGVGRRECDNGVLLLVSINNRQIYISTGASSAEVLTEDVLEVIIQDARPLLRDEL